MQKITTKLERKDLIWFESVVHNKELMFINETVIRQIKNFTYKHSHNQVKVR